MNSLSNTTEAPEGISSEKKRPGAFYLWRHPIRARKMIDELSSDLNDLRDLLDKSEYERRRLADENNLLGERVRIAKDESARQKSEYKNKIAQLERNSDHLQQEIEDWRHTRTELDAMAARIAEWEEMKADYEKQIKDLTLRLNDALGNFRGAKSPSPTKINVSDILEDGDSLYAEPKPKRPGRRQTPPADDSDWLIPLPL